MRLSLLIGNTPGTDSRLSEDKIRAYKHFANKLWNVARFILSETTPASFEEKPALTQNDEEIYAHLQETIRDITSDIEAYRLYLAAEKIYHYLWHTLADGILEKSKPILKDGDAGAKASRQWLLAQELTTILSLLHPFAPFVTEEIWSHVPGKNRLLMVSSWPSFE